MRRGWMSQSHESHTAGHASDDGAWRRRTLLTAATLLLALAAMLPGRAQPAPATPRMLAIADGTAERHFSAAELLARPDVADLSVTEDVYHHAVTYRAVPLLALLGGNPGDRFDTVEAQAADG